MNVWKATVRGHPIYLDDGGVWRFTDDDSVIQERPCITCGEPCTPAGHDACLGSLPDVANACCGHGSAESAYIHFVDGRVLEGADALAEFAKAGRGPA